MDISKFSTAQLEALVRAAQKEKRRKQKRKPATKVRAIIEKAAKASGYTLAEVFGELLPASRRTTPAKGKPAPRKSASGKVAPKYRNPENAEQTWTGRGSQPRWMAEALARGVSLDSLRVEAANAP